jgi:5-methylcytosine-specific restriction protein A
MRTRRNPLWTRDELILALDLYFRCDPVHTSEKNLDIIELSRVLNRLPIHTVQPDVHSFRSPGAVYMKLCNFLRLDPEYSGKGLDAGSKMDEVVWNDYAQERERLEAVAVAIRAQAENSSPSHAMPIEEDWEAPEGEVLVREHRVRERDSTLVARRKASARRSDSYACEVCGFDRKKRHAPLSDAAIECHHRVPLAQLRPGQRTRLSDLALVCASCHRMLHGAGRGVLPVEELRSRMLAGC